MAQVYLNYAALMCCAGGQDSLGGRLLYAAELDARGIALAIAGNIAGAATLAATADQTASRQAMREGVVDFLVTTLDEALRILKNQLRKREPASVCVGRTPQEVVREMLERGVQPDMLPATESASSGSFAQFIALGAERIEPRPLAPGQTLFTVEIPPGSMRQSARIEETLAASIEEGDLAGRRWLRLSPRYLGPGARRARSLVCNAAAVVGLRAELAKLSS
jgi:hypothetical protein